MSEYAALNQQFKLDSVFGGTPLHKFAIAEDWDKLLAAGADDVDLLRTLNEHRRTPLHYAVESGASEDVILELIRLGPFQVRVRDVSGNTPLHVGCQFGMPLVVVYGLLEADAKNGRGRKSVLFLVNNDNMTPLQIMQLPQKASSTVGKWFNVDWKVNVWQRHRDQAEAVMQVLEESARGETGVVGLAY